jgi:tetratricopeptide (TPR) repeat protein
MMLWIAAVALSFASWATPNPHIMPTLAFFLWAYLIAPLVIDPLFEHFEEYGERSRTAVSSRIDEGNRALASGDISKALMSFEAAYNLKPDQLEVALRLGDALRQSGRHAEAVVILEDAVVLHAGVVALHLDLARALCGAQQSGRSIEQVEMILAIDPLRRASIATDRELEPLYDEPSFRSLVLGD